jgi:WhiB family redox-sensing transcriptional regulator
MSSTAWSKRSACAGMDVELFFPLTERGPRASALIEQAKAVCRRCAVVHECLDAALALTDTDGIWG